MSAASSLRRLAAAHWPLLVVCAFFPLVGALVVDDYGVSPDEMVQRRVGNEALDYLAGDGELVFAQPHLRYFGMAFEAPLVLAERILGLEDSRDIYLGRHVLTHLFFLAGGVFAYLLVLRIFNRRPLALLAMVLFLAHPVIYVHSFLNSKDVPALAAFMVSLYLVHRAFRRDTLAAFLLCGAGVGLLVNIRVAGVMLFAAVLALRALDLALASRAGERRRVLATGTGFALAAMLAYYATLPALWTDTLSHTVEAVRNANPPNETWNLFRGEWLYSRDGPSFAYVPVWVGITTPPATLLLALIGAVALAWRGLGHPRDLPRNGPSRFGMLLIALPVAAVVAVVVLGGNVYNGWRQLYFLYAPLLLLAIFGIHWLAHALRGRWTRTGAYVLAGAAVAVTVVSMARIHPHQDRYFNALVDRTTPEHPASRYDMRYWRQSGRAVLDDISADHPSGPLFLAAVPRDPPNEQILPPDDRERFTETRDFRSGERNFHALHGGQPCPARDDAYVAGIYASTIACVVDPVAYFGGLRREALATEPLDRSRFDAYRVGKVMVYLRDGCSPDDLRTRVFLHVHPADSADLPADLPTDFTARFSERWRYRTGFAFESRDFVFSHFGARIDGNCVAVAPLPDYPIASIRTGQRTPETLGAAWRAAAGSAPLARSFFTVWSDGRELIYARETCSPEDAAARFFLHVYPGDEGYLPDYRRRHGFDNHDFAFAERGAIVEGACVATALLPGYPIAAIRTGQHDAGERLWEVEIVPPEGE